ncbi:MAG: DUF3836 domain-containing protein [Tannerellaceae bacterium]|jgi:hypothetical protein|nr:DUF3836 domain-containing protein [Tannerellaceae bacterium]
MKPSVLNRTIWGFILVFVCSMTMSAVSPKNYLYDTKEENGKIVSKTIFLQKDGLLDKQWKYDFTYNEEGKVAEKKACRWNAGKEVWEPFYQITYRYEKETGEIHSSYGLWNKKANDYTLNAQIIILPEDRYEEIFL